jgi:putative DNA primase/helicase
MSDRRRKADIEASVEKPTPLKFNPAGFPAELKGLKQIVHWRFQRKDDNDKWSKVPRCRAKSASSTDPATWMTFDFALEYFLTRGRKNGLDGLGFVFSPDDPFAGVDLDDCRDPDTGEVDAWALPIIKTLDSYTEVSPSRTGFKIWVRGKKPPGACKVKYESGEVEVYDQGRYFAMTGHHLEGTPTTVNERGEQLAAVFLQVFGEQANEKAEDKQAGQKRRPSPSRNGHSEGGGRLSDDEVILKAGKSKQAAKFKALWGGDTSGYADDDSRADLALCCILAFWCGRDREQMDRLFRQSGLIRAKWDEQHGEETYGARTISVAIAGCDTVYERPVKVQWQPSGKKKAASASTNGQPHSEDDAAEDAEMFEAMGYGIILAYFRTHYAPVFRRGQVMHSAALGRDVKMGEACAAPGIKLVQLLTEAVDCPRSNKGPDYDSIPCFFRNWAPSAWKDMLAELPEEEASVEVVASAEDEFRGKVATALFTHASLGYRHQNDNGEWITEVQRRPLIHWCRLFVKSKWADIRGYQLWCRKDNDTGFQVALRKELFGQVQGCGDLARISATKFTRLVEAYQVGTGERVKGARVVVLAPTFLAYLEERPEADTSADRTETHAGARENEVSKCHEVSETLSAQGVSDDTLRDTSCADAQSVTQSVNEIPPY